ncbi:FMN-binding negative transcriptional regulator [Pseudomonadota bacterium]
MYIPKLFEENDTEILHRLILAHPFASLITNSDDGIDANHIPFLLDRNPLPFGTLRGHIARANPLWREPIVGQAMVIFQGPESYISPSWYPSKQDSGKVVPTWNYTVVHAHGKIRFIEDTKWLRDFLETLTHEHEGERSQPWRLTDAPEEYIERSLQIIVGIEFEVTRLVGKWKVSQNRPERDKLGVIDGLLEEGKTTSSKLVKEKLAKR